MPFKSDAYVSDQFGKYVLTTMLPIFLRLIYIIPLYRLVQNLVGEKESRARESMRMMGLSESSYWLSWFVYYLLVVTTISLLCLIVTSGNVWMHSSKGLVFLFLWVYGLSLFGLSVCVQSFFSSAKVAATFNAMFYFGTGFIATAVMNPDVSESKKNIASILPTIAVELASNNLGMFEGNGQGLTMATVNDVYQNYKFQTGLVVMVISLVVFTCIGIYLDNVLPSAFGLRKPWYFLFTSRYWFGVGNQRGRIQNR